MTQSPVNQPIDLDSIYREVLAEVHRAFVFMRFGHRSPGVMSFDETELPGRFQIYVVPEPMSPEVIKDYEQQYVSWILGNGLRDLVEAFANFLNRIYEAGLKLVPTADYQKRLRLFESQTLRPKVQTLRDQFQIEGMYARHFESFVNARNSLAHGAGVVRNRDCNDGNELVISWRGVDPAIPATDGNYYDIAAALPDGVELLKTWPTKWLAREKRWKIGERIRLTPLDLSEITFMAAHEAVDVCDALCEFALKHGIRLKQVTVIRGGSDDP